MESKFLLPENFKNLIRKILGEDEFEGFLASYEHDNYVGLRINTLKGSVEELKQKSSFTLSPVDWCDTGFYYEKEERPGKSPLHEAGAYYIQEPSAMSAVEWLDVAPGDYVLDMCAAPGGKSTQIAGKLSGEGLLVSNEIIKDRARILSSNIERMGVRNALVLNESPKGLVAFGKFNCFFDRILVDAPCSGEGMFKKEEFAISEWSLENVKLCHERQLEILGCAAEMLKAGGTLVFSTCTFNNIENEGTVKAFLSEHPEFSLIKDKHLWPHIEKGEGHYVAKLIKAGVLSENNNFYLDTKKKELYWALRDFLLQEVGIKESVLCKLLNHRAIVTFGDNYYLLPEGILNTEGLKVERPGLQLAVSKTNRFEPAHSLALSLRPEDLNEGKSFDLDMENAKKYISGETIACEPSLKGWIVMMVSGYSIGFGKASGGVIKNHYPKGLRR